MSSKNLKNLKGEIVTLDPQTQSGLYIGMLTDTLGRMVSIMDKKLGTTKSFINRLMQLSNTKGPIQILFLKMYIFEGTETAGIVEKIFQTLLYPIRTEGEWFKDEDGMFVNQVVSALNQLQKLGIKWEEVVFVNDEQLSTDVKDTIKETTAHTYWDWDNIPDADINNPDSKYSIWELKTPFGEKWYQNVTLGPTVTRSYCGTKKLTPELAMNYCNAANFLRTVDYNHTKLTATFITSSNDKEEINNFCINNGLSLFRKDYNKS